MGDYLERKIDYAVDPAVASAWDEVSLWGARFGLLLLGELELRPNLAILDLGCGSGFPLFELAGIHGPGCRLVGVDAWAHAIERAAFKRGVYGLESVSLVVADGARLPLAGAAFDLIVSNLGINNFEDPPAVFAECGRVAKPGARLAFTTNVAGHMREFYDAYRETLVALGLEARLGRLAAHEAHRGTRESVCALVEAGGFRVARVVERECALRYLDGSAFLRHWLTVLGFLGGWRAVVEPGEERAVFAALEARLDTLARASGELRTTVPMLYVEGVREE